MKYSQLQEKMSFTLYCNMDRPGGDDAKKTKKENEKYLMISLQ